MMSSEDRGGKTYKTIEIDLLPCQLKTAQKSGQSKVDIHRQGESPEAAKFRQEG